MNTTPYRRIVAAVVAVVVASTMVAVVAVVSAAAHASISISTGTTGASASGPADRPCFMFRAQWNDAEGPQPTCPVPTWQVAAGGVASPAADTGSTARTAPAVAASARIGDFMP
jgi:hypothetical protein